MPDPEDGPRRRGADDTISSEDRRLERDASRVGAERMVCGRPSMASRAQDAMICRRRSAAIGLCRVTRSTTFMVPRYRMAPKPIQAGTRKTGQPEMQCRNQLRGLE